MIGKAGTRRDWPVTLELLARMGCGAIILDSSDSIVARNSVAAALVSDWTSAIPADSQAVVRDLAAVSGKPRWLRRKRQPPLIVRLIEQLSSPQQKLLLLIDPAAPVPLDVSTMRTLFGLTAAEADLAVRLARGERVKEIAQARSVGIGTVRTQLRTVFRKTRTASQAGLVLLLARLAAIQPTAGPKAVSP
jgi:DNA-binding CsgD family transcriptional regulator